MRPGDGVGAGLQTLHALKTKRFWGKWAQGVTVALLHFVTTENVKICIYPATSQCCLHRSCGQGTHDGRTLRRRAAPRSCAASSKVLSVLLGGERGWRTHSPALWSVSASHWQPGVEMTKFPGHFSSLSTSAAGQTVDYDAISKKKRKTYLRRSTSPLKSWRQKLLCANVFHARSECIAPTRDPTKYMTPSQISLQVGWVAYQ